MTVSGRVWAVVGAVLVSCVVVLASTPGRVTGSSARDAARLYFSEEYGLDADEADALLAVKAAAVDTADRLSGDLGGRVLNVLIDAGTGHLTVTVTDQAAARVVETQGATALVGAPVDGLDVRAEEAVAILTGYGIDGFMVGVTPRGDGLNVTVPDTVSVDVLSGVEEDLFLLGVPVTIDIVAPIVPVSSDSLLLGGEYLSNNGQNKWCSAGFNVERISDGKRFLMTAGHCFDVGDDVWDLEYGWGESVYIGKVVRSDYMNGTGDDVAFIALDDADAVGARGEVLYDTDFDIEFGDDDEERVDGERIEITRIASAYVGMDVCRTGGTSGTDCGVVTGIGVSGGPNFTELIHTDVCSISGDSGGPLYTLDGEAVGLLRGSRGDGCPDGEFSFYQRMDKFTNFRALGSTLELERGQLSR